VRNAGRGLDRNAGGNGSGSNGARRKHADGHAGSDAAAHRDPKPGADPNDAREGTARTNHPASLRAAADPVALAVTHALAFALAFARGVRHAGCTAGRAVAHVILS
jgi:hypothetical protein